MGDGWVSGVVLVLVVLVLGLAVLGIRAELSDGSYTCQVTEQSLKSHPDWYTGGDHPANPQVNDWYWCSSGPIPGERVCRTQSRWFLWTERVDCENS